MIIMFNQQERQIFARDLRWSDAIAFFSVISWSIYGSKSYNKAPDPFYGLSFIFILVSIGHLPRPVQPWSRAEQLDDEARDRNQRPRMMV